MEKAFCFAALKSSLIDSAAGKIFGVSVITEGPARGHDLLVDSTTLVQVKAAAEQFANGLQVKMDHGSGFEGIVGVLKNFAISSGQLRADLSLLQKNPARELVLEMAEMMPGSFGLSIAFSGDHEEKEGDTVRLARCTEIYSADLVDVPAANPGGLFSARIDTVKARDNEIVSLRAERTQLATELHRIRGLYVALKGSLGLNPAGVVPAISPLGIEAGSIVETYKAMSAGPDRVKYLETHREVITAALAAETGA